MIRVRALSTCGSPRVRRWAVGCLIALTVLAAWAAPRLVAQDSPAATLVWAAADGADGYIVYWGTAPRTYSNSANVGAATQWQIPTTSEDQTLYMVVVAYDRDGQISQPSAEVTSRVNPNQPPTAADDLASTNEDVASAPIAVIANDTDPDNDLLTVTSAAVTNSQAGTVAIGGDETLTFTPALDFHGTTTITYTVLDGRGGSDTASVTMTVIPVNDAPKALADTASVAEDSVDNEIRVVLNDTDVDDTTLTVGDVTDPPHGTVSVSGGSVLYTPEPGYAGADSFTYTVQDAAGLTDIGQVNVTVDNANDAPVATADEYAADEDATLTVPAPGVLGNDTDADNDSLSAAVGTPTSNGTLVLSADGSFSYTPNANYSGADSFTYTVSDANGGSAVGVVNITVGPANDAPVAVNDSYSTAEDTPLTVAAAGVLTNDTDADLGDAALSAVLVARPAHGELTLNADGSFTFTPAENFSGSDSFTYKANDGGSDSNVATVSITVDAANDAPVASDDSAATDEDTPLTGSVLGNDTDVDTETLTAILVAGPTAAQGTLVLAPDGTFTFSPVANFSGPASFTYKAHDGTTDSNVATVTITVNAVNDAAVAVNDEFSTREDVALSVPSRGVLGNDTDIDDESASLTAVLAEGPAHGTVVLNADGSFLYTPAANFSGSDTFTYRANDGTVGSNLATVAIAITAVNDAPVAVDDEASLEEDSGPNAIPVLANDTDSDGDTKTITSVTQGTHGAVTIADGGTGLTYASAPDYSGPDTFTYTISDGTGTATATVSVLVTNVNDAPVAVDDTATVAEDSAATAVDVLANDTDADGDTRTITAVSQGANGAVAVASGGTGLTYTPSANFAGADTFTYTIDDGKGATDTATVTVTVMAVNDAPVAADDAFNTNEDVTLTVVQPNVLGNDTDADGEASALTAAVLATPAHGTLVLSANGSFTYTPAENFNGTDSFTYKANDGSLDSNVATVTITIASVNDGPDAKNDEATTNEDVAVDIPVLGNDTDPDGGTVSVSEVGAPAHGTASLNANGSVKYTPTANYFGPDSFSYTISDGQGGSATASVSVSITAVNDGPTAADDTASTAEDTAVDIAVLSNDLDADGGAVALSAVGAAAHGTASANANGSVRYVPNANYFGSDTFTYTIEDGQGGTASASVVVTVSAVNDGPTAENDTATTVEDRAVDIAVLANDADQDGGTVTLESVGEARNGATSVNPDGTVKYTPNADYFGPDAFTYTIADGQGGTASAAVTVMVESVNDGPLAADDQATTDEDEAVVIAVLANDNDREGGTVSVTTVGSPANGTATANADGTIRYVPNANFSGTDTFTYKASDGTAESLAATVTVTVKAVNDAPVASADSATVGEDSGANAIDVLTNDTDVESDELRISAVTQGSNGAVVITAAGAGVTYAPNENFSGSDSFTYTVEDGHGGTASATVTIAVDGVNDGPSAVDDTATTTEDTPTDIAVLGNDTDPDGGTVTVTAVGSAAHGSVAVNESGTVRYAPNSNYVGEDRFTYTISDGQGGTATASVVVTITSVNDAPVAVDDSFSTTEDTAVGGNVVANDTDPDEDALSAARGTGPANGTLVLGADGSFTYTPNADFTGTDSFTYTVSDGNGGSDTGTVVLTIDDVNDAPIARGDAYGIDEDTTLTVGLPGVLGNDTDTERSALTAVLVTDVSNGTLTLNANGTFTYTPSANYHGVETFTYKANDGTQDSEPATVSIRVNPVNDPPTAADDAFATSEDAAVNGDVLTNDRDVDGNPLSAAAGTAPAHGTLVLNANGSFTYTPNADFTGADAFSYTVTDGNGGSAVGNVTVTVNGANDAPVAKADMTTVSEDSANNAVDVLANDVDADGDALTVTAVTQGAHGSVAVAGGGVSYTPAPNFTGTDSFTYTIGDGQGGVATAAVDVAVTPANDAPAANADAASVLEDSANNPIDVLANDADVDGDTLTVTAVTQGTQGSVSLAAGVISYTPNANYVGADSFTYTVTDAHGATGTAAVSITVTNANDAPSANDDAASVAEDSASHAIDVLANDTDSDGDTLSLTAVTQGGNGSVAIAGNGVAYTPNPDFVGTDRFSYTISDGSGGSDSAVVTVTVTNGNDAPVANADSATVGEDTAGNLIAVLGNDTDLDSDALTVVAVTQGANGAVAIAPGGVTYTPNADYAGADSFTYTVSDGQGGSATAAVSVTVTSVNDAPVAVEDSIATGEDTPVNGNVLANDTDVDGGALTATLVGSTANGVLVLNPDGSFSYTPNLDFSGTDSFTYTVNDGNGGSDTGTATIAVSAANDAPVAGNDSFSTNEDAALNVPAPGLLGNDADADSQLTVGLVSGPANGALTLNADGSFTYVPNADYSGVDGFTYRASDGTSSSDASVAITINPVNDAPVAAADSVTVIEDSGSNAIVVLGNDADVDDASLSVTAVTQGMNGAVAIVAGGITYTPQANFVGTDSFSYTVSDAAGATASATVTVIVTAIDDAPVAVDDAATTNEETPVAGNVLANDLDAENGALSAVLVTGPAAAQGTVALSADGSFIFTPAANFNGVASFTYRANDGGTDSNVATVSIAVAPVNDGPVSSDDSYFARGGAMLIVDAPGVLANDADADNAMTALLVSEPAHGAVVLNANGGFTYTPAAGFTGPDSFTYQGTDGSLSSEIATVSIFVASELVMAEIGGETRTVTTDAAGDGPTPADPVDTAVTSPVDGTVTIAESAASVAAPEGYSFLGQQVLITAPAATADNPLTIVFTLEGSLLPAGQNKDTIVVFRNGVPVATCDEGTNGSASPDPCVAARTVVGGDIQLSIRSSAASSWNFGTSLANTAPVASDDSYAVDENETLTVAAPGVLANDADADGNTLSASMAGAPANGTVMLKADGSFAYTPKAGFSGADRFTYTVSDGRGESNIATASITVNATSHPPVAQDDSASVAEDSGAKVIYVLGNDTDPDGDRLTIAAVTQGTNGTVTISAYGSALTYAPKPNFSGTDSFTYTISDGHAVATATVSVSVSAVNDNPDATNDTATVLEGSVAVTIDVVANDTTVEAGETLTIKAVSQADYGTVTISSGTAVRYTPDAGFTGTDRFTYTIQDGNGGSATATVTVTVQAKPTITINDVEVVEGNIGMTGATLTVRLSHAVVAPVTVKYGTSEGIARAGQDFEAASGTVTFAAGEVAKPVTVKVVGDGTKERSEVFGVTLSTPTNATIARTSGYVTIVDDDSSQVATSNVSNSGRGRGDRELLRLRALDDQVARAGDRVDLDLKVRHADLEDLTVVVEGLPEGLRYDAREGAIVGRLSRNDSPGEYTVTVKISDGRTESTGTFDWVVRASKGSS